MGRGQQLCPLLLLRHCTGVKVNMVTTANHVSVALRQFWPGRPLERAWEPLGVDHTRRTTGLGRELPWLGAGVRGLACGSPHSFF